MSRLLPYVAVFMLAGFVPVMAQTSGSSQTGSTSNSTAAMGSTAMTKMTPVQFVMQAKMGSQFEIASSTLALDRAQNDKVKEFAQRMVDDHKMADDQLREVLNQNSALKKQVDQQMNQMEKSQDRMNRTATGTGVSAQAMKGQDGVLSPMQLEMMQRLRNTGEGAAFDREYVTAQREAHRMSIEQFSAYAQNGTDNSLKDFAVKTLPVLQEHARMLEQMQL